MGAIGKRVLGVDLAYEHTGLAFIVPPHETSVQPMLQVLETTNEKPDLGRQAYIAETIRDLFIHFQMDLVALEGPGYYSSKMRGQPHRTGELHGVVKFVLDEAHIPVRIVPPTVWRRVCFGNGSMRQKEQLRLDVFKKFGMEHKHVDALEAFCVALTVYKTNLPPENLHKYELEAIMDWLNPKVKRTRKVAA